MNNPTDIPAASVLLRDDSGLGCEVWSGLFAGDAGTVVHGPYEYRYTVKTKVLNKNGKPGCRVEERISAPQYAIMVPRWGRTFHFVANEVRGLKPVPASTLRR